MLFLDSAFLNTLIITTSEHLYSPVVLKVLTPQYP